MTQGRGEGDMAEAITKRVALMTFDALVRIVCGKIRDEMEYNNLAIFIAVEMRQEL